MLDLNFNVDIDVKKIRSPLYFQHRNVCTKCGATGSLIFIDRFGKECSREINAFEQIKCKNCGKVFSILWEPKDGSDKMYPSAVDSSIKKDFSNLVNYYNIKRNGKNELSE